MSNRGLLRFRRAARVVFILIKVCIIVKQILADRIRQKPWFCLIDNVVSNTIQQKRKGPRAFVTFVQNEKTRSVEQLTFDLSEFQRRNKEHLVTEEVREALRTMPGQRSTQQVAKIIRCLKNMSPEFNSYMLPTQKRICQCAFYDKYKFNRVILRKGLPADGIYFVLSGMCVAKLDTKKNSLKEITAGEKFGEEDLVCGCPRRQTVLTKTDAEIFYLHRIDYKDIFSMSPDANDPKNLDICKQDVVFQHFPMGRLIENPGTWSVNKYKYGRLIAKDSNDLEWIYVIKGGEARILKYLSPGHIDLRARRKKIQQQMMAQSPFHKKRQILNFIEERDYIKSAYKPATYHPQRRKGLMSAPASTRYRESLPHSKPFYSLPPTPAARPTPHPQSRSVSKLEPIQDLDSENDDVKLPKIKTDESENDNEEEQKEDEAADDGDEKKTPRKASGERTPRAGSSMMVTLGGVGRRDSERSTRRPSTVHHAAASRHSGTGSFIRTPLSGRCRQPRKGVNPSLSSSVANSVLPAFVQVETLHPGQVFGLRACLDAEERGPSVSLVSGECEVLQINKKFFMKHCDDALNSLIRLKAKAFPDQEELIDRLDANMQWEEFKKQTLNSYLKQRSRHTR